MTADTLYLLVTCSMDKTRQALACDVAKNLVAQNAVHSFFDDLLIFDNHSRFEDHLQLFPSTVKVVRSDKNIGYWSAINWALAHYAQLFSRQYKYLYIIESDLEHRNMHRLDACEQFLKRHPEIGGIRTQEFSIKWRMLYDKKYHWLPFARRHSLVSQNNAITGERVWFRHGDVANGIWLTNFHAKLPALNRMESLTAVFETLSRNEQVTELDFMHEYYRLHPTMAILDGGIYHMLSSSGTKHLSGSYSSASQLSETGYHNTRIDHIVRDGFAVCQIEKKNVPEKAAVSLC
jgi:hypothetical protein